MKSLIVAILLQIYIDPSVNADELTPVLNILPRWVQVQVKEQTIHPTLFMFHLFNPRRRMRVYVGPKPYSNGIGGVATGICHLQYGSAYAMGDSRIIAHEVGHLLGVNHETGNAIMAPVINTLPDPFIWSPKARHEMKRCKQGWNNKGRGIYGAANTKRNRR